MGNMSKKMHTNGKQHTLTLYLSVQLVVPRGESYRPVHINENTHEQEQYSTTLQIYT